MNLPEANSPNPDPPEVIDLERLPQAVLTIAGKQWPLWVMLKHVVTESVHICPGKPRWAVVGNMLGLGSVASQSLCRRFDADPHDRGPLQQQPDLDGWR